MNINGGYIQGSVSIVTTSWTQVLPAVPGHRPGPSLVWLNQLSAANSVDVLIVPKQMDPNAPAVTYKMDTISAGLPFTLQVDLSTMDVYLKANTATTDVFCAAFKVDQGR